MKTALLIRVVPVAALLFAIGLLPVHGAEQAEQKMRPGQQLKTVKEADSVEPGDMVVIACPKCRTVTYTVAEGKAGQLTSKPWLKTAKNKDPQAELKTVCEECNAETFCCIIKKKDLVRQPIR